MERHNWYVLTGGPSSGKTTLLEELQKRGHNTIKESARYYIETQLAKGQPLEIIRKEEKNFQEAVFRQKQIIHDALATDVTTFFDRGYHDTLAYLMFHEYKIARFIREACKGMNYKKIFLLDMLPYKKDRVRTETAEMAKGLHEALLKAYEESGHEVIKVPVLPVKERVEFILSHIESGPEAA